MDLETAVKLGQLLFVVAQAIVLLVILLMKSNFATKKDLAAASELGANAHHRLDLLEQRVGHLPTHDTLQEIRDDVGDLKEGQAKTVAGLDGLGREIGLVRAAVVRVDDFLRAAK